MKHITHSAVASVFQAAQAACMAVLRKVASGDDVKLRGRTVVGRSLRAGVRLSGSAASAEHACIAWTGEHWVIRDLKSRNGLTINGAPLSGRTWRLEVGDTIIFGDPTERWVWLSGEAPRAVATRDDGVRIEAQGQLLFLDSGAGPEALVRMLEGAWHLDYAGTLNAVEDGAQVSVGGRTFVLELPELEDALALTRTLLDHKDIANAQVVFHVSLDEEHVELSLVTGNEAHRLPPRAYHYALLLLARARLQDQENGVPELEAGWIYADSLAEQLRTTVQNVNVDIHRARQIIERLGKFDNAADLVQRRKTTTQLRLGPRHISILDSERERVGA